MADYQTMYRTLFNAITESIALLQDAQKTTEDIFISSARVDEDSSSKNNI